MNTTGHSASQLRQAACLQEQIEELQVELANSLETGAPVAPAVAPAPAKKFTMSVSARKKLSAFQKARWAKLKAAKK